MGKRLAYADNLMTLHMVSTRAALVSLVSISTHHGRTFGATVYSPGARIWAGTHIFGQHALLLFRIPAGYKRGAWSVVPRRF